MTEEQHDALISAIESAAGATTLNLQLVCWSLGVVAGLLAWQVLLVGKDHLTFWGRKND